MPYVPRISGRECRTALERAGFIFHSQNGSHMKMRKGSLSVSVPDHRELDTGMARAIIRQAGLTVDEFKDLLK